MKRHVMLASYVTDPLASANMFQCDGKDERNQLLHQQQFRFIQIHSTETPNRHRSEKIKGRCVRVNGESLLCVPLAWGHPRDLF